ncbi:centromere protein I isoform X2 [Ochotona curzoniae]|uniref:centromere protein I isoform X2 n=1 Tax=Ochotona curzoniae TaxID=130825 RepID=UPI001B353DBD|nr:centromere protein I isoform X2 [Ochotona curzoniae]
MMPQKRENSSQTERKTLQDCYRTDLSAWEVEEKPGDSSSILKRDKPVEDCEHAEDQAGDALQKALGYFEKDPTRNLRSKDKNLEKHLIIVENVAWKNGLSPEAIDILLNVALCGRFGNAINTRILKCLIPATVISEDSVVKAVSWLCVGKCSGSTKVLFYRWLIAMFDFIDHKEQINLLYGFFFASLQDDDLCPYVCHLLYLITKKENVKPFRVRKLLDLQAKMIYFRNSENLWKTALLAVRQRNQGLYAEPIKLMLGPTEIRPLKRRWKSHSIIPVLNSSTHINEYGKKEMSLSDCLCNSGSLPLEQLQRFPQLLENIHCLELPSQMGSVLNNSLLLHYINCIKDESVLQRLYYWLSQTLQEECVWYKVKNYENEKEFTNFLDTIIRAESFLHDGFYSCEVFLCKSLPLWDGFCCRSQVLQLVSWIPFNNFSELKPLLFDHLAHLFFTSTIYFKCSVLESLKELLQNWLLWLSKDIHLKSETNSALDGSICESMDSVCKLIHHVGWLSTIALRLESNSTFLMHFILDFYEKVCDIHMHYNLPVLTMLPRTIFYSALLTLDASILNQLCYIMHRYHTNLTAAKKNELLQKEKSKLNFNSKIYQEFNCCLATMVGSLWTSRPFNKGICLTPEILGKLGIEEYRKSLNLVHHPSLLSYAVSFLLQDSPENKTIKLSSIQGKKWNLYVDYLLSEEFQGLKLFMQSCIRRSSIS